MQARVVSVWRYPVKSLGGERIPRAEILHTVGIPGDRGYALRDDRVGEIRGAKQIPSLLRCSARYLAEPVRDATPPIEVAFPDGVTLRSDDANVSKRLSEVAGKPLTLVARRPASDADFYARKEPFGLEEMRTIFALEPDEPLPDLSEFGPEILMELAKYASPRGTFFDTVEIHLVSTQTLASLQQRLPDSIVDVRRFRPNLLVEFDGGGERPEQQLRGRKLRAGSAVLEVVAPMVRCGMITQPQPQLPKDAQILRTLVREQKQQLGAALRVLEPGVVAEGDRVEVL
ncbi:MAG TPA: MOSC domain-containing protein [Myxococcota bacterium]|nr:MOSC domain-containing protein [Myxococcota bacterium]